MTAAVDLFAGAGGWSEACRQLGIDELGIELDPAACKTRRAAGHRTAQGDAASMKLHDPTGYTGLIASPPCQAFSAAGKGTGRDHIPALLGAIYGRRWGARPDPDPKVWLVLEVGRWYEAIRPEWVALEQVPAVLPLWEAYAHVLRSDGYSVWTGLLCAADYGVPQTRTRAILIASRTRPALPPTPTHAEHPGVALFDQRQPWVTMADALPELVERLGLNWSMAKMMGEGMVARHGERPERPATSPAFTLRANGGGNATCGLVIRTGRAAGQRSTPSGSQEVDLDCPVPAVTGQSRSWVLDRPGSSDAIRLTIRDALILQGFRPDYPVQGSKTKQFEQVGNAICPPLAKAILGQVVG